MLNLSKTVYFVAGLPRSGSTLLMNILGQNPRFHVGGTSGIVDVLQYVRGSWNRNTAFMAMDRDRSSNLQLSVMRGILEGYCAVTDRPVCMEKNRIWPEFLEMAAAILGGRDRVKVLLPVRDVRDVLASFEKRYRDTTSQAQVGPEATEPFRFKTAVQRIEYFVESSQPVGRAFNAIRDAATRGWLDRMHFIEYDGLTASPRRTLDGIYDFLGEAPFHHDFEQVEQLNAEDDLIYGFKDLHTTRPKVAPQPPSWPSVYDRTVLGSKQWQDVEKLATFWRAYTQG
jgi:sulfotransferase